jgi:hypothetical protein
MAGAGEERGTGSTALKKPAHFSGRSGSPPPITQVGATEVIRSEAGVPQLKVRE